MKIHKEKINRFLYVFDYDFSLDNLQFCRYIKSVVGWEKFNFYEKKWRFNDVSVVEMLKKKYPELEIDPEVEVDLKRFQLEKQADEILIEEGNKIKEKTDTDLVIQNVTGELYDFQKIGVEFLINSNGRAILADTMGLGKTLQALAFVAHTEKKKTLVVCPASVKYSWESEVAKWTKLKSFVIDSKLKKNKKIDMIQLVNDHDIFIINYDIVKSYLVFLQNINWDCLIGDEFHFIKNNNAQRTKAFKMIASRIPSVLLLSGTPIFSRPLELFNGLNLMDPVRWNNWFEYTKKYCQGHQSPFGWDARGASNIAELQQKISRYFLRRKKEDVLTDLPEKQFIDYPVELDPEKRFEYDLVEANFVEYLKEIKNKKDPEIAKTLQAERLVKLGELRQITSQGKIKATQDLISQIIDNNEKVVVFSSFNDPLVALEKVFKDVSVRLTGDTPDFMRKAAIDSFQNDPNIKIFFGGMKSASAGITLTAGQNVIFIDFSYVPADHLQGQDRIHRIGSKFDYVSIYQLFAKDTIDEKMQEMLKGKQEIFDQIFEGGKGNSTKSIVADLLKKYENS